MSSAQFAHLAELDMGAVQQSQVDAIFGYADLWIRILAPNQSIWMNGHTRPRIGADAANTNGAGLADPGESRQFPWMRAAIFTPRLAVRASLLARTMARPATRGRPLGRILGRPSAFLLATFSR
jgi:hypothetical protein